MQAIAAALGRPLTYVNVPGQMPPVIRCSAMGWPKPDVDAMMDFIQGVRAMERIASRPASSSSRARNRAPSGSGCSRISPPSSRRTLDFRLRPSGDGRSAMAMRYGRSQ